MKFTEIYDAFVTHDKTELEFRLRVNKLLDAAKLYKQIILEKNDGVYLEQSITTQTNPIRKESYYKNGVKIQDKERYVEKRLIREQRDLDSSIVRKVVVSTENKVDKVALPLEKLRFKYRACVLVGDWRWDFTAVKQIIVNDRVPKNFLVRHIKEFFGQPNVTPATFTDVFNSGVSQVEIEVEYIGKRADLTVDKIISQYDTIKTKVDASYNPQLRKWLNALAEKLFNDDSMKGKLLKDIVNNPKEMNNDIYRKTIYGQEGWYCSPKADGERTILWITPSKIVALSHDVKLYDVDVNNEYIVDCENIDGTYYMFDCLYHIENLMKQTYENRITYLENCEKMLKKIKFPAAIKEIVKLVPSNVSIQLERILDKKRVYPIDGLIFTENASAGSKPNYFADIYKWKFPEKNTIDFLAKRLPEKLVGHPKYSVAGKETILLYVTSRNKRHRELHFVDTPDELRRVFTNDKKQRKKHPVLFGPSNDPTAYIYHTTASEAEAIANHIVEMRYEDGWKVERIRIDKDYLVTAGNYFGNSIDTAVTVWGNIKNPITRELLLDPSSIVGYFQHEKKAEYNSSTAFHSFVKSKLIIFLKGSAFPILDLAAGKGQDLFRYDRQGIKRLVCVDIDKDAIAELQKRATKLKYTKINTLVMDLNSPRKETAKALSKFSTYYGGAVINFALHYLNPDSIAKLVYDLLYSGIFIVTVYNGNSVRKLLDNKGGHWKSDKWEIKYADSSDNRIMVKLPFSSELYEEALIDTDSFVSSCEKMGFKLVVNMSFEKMLEDFRISSPSVAAQLTEDDILHSSLYQAIVLRKDPPKKKN